MTNDKPSYNWHSREISLCSHEQLRSYIVLFKQISKVSHTFLNDICLTNTKKQTDYNINVVLAHLKVAPWFSGTPQGCTAHTHLHHVHCGIWLHQRQHGDREAPGSERMKSLIGDEGGRMEGGRALSPSLSFSLQCNLTLSEPQPQQYWLSEWGKKTHTSTHTVI